MGGEGPIIWDVATAYSSYVERAAAGKQREVVVYSRWKR